MTEEFSFDVDEESIKQLESVIDEEVIKIHERFDNGTETLEDLLYQYPHIVLKCELKNKQEVDLDVVERKYYERLAGRAKLQDTEINKLNNVIDRMTGVIDRAYFDRNGMEDWFENEILPKDEFGLVDYKEKYIRQPIIKEYFMKEDK